MIIEYLFYSKSTKMFVLINNFIYNIRQFKVLLEKAFFYFFYTYYYYYL